MSGASINWGSVADWVSGLGSLVASGVALYLGLSHARIKLSGTCGLRTILGGGAPAIEVFNVWVVNRGTRTTVVTNIGLSVGRHRKTRRHAIVLFPRDPGYSPGMPYSLADGVSASWSVPTGVDRAWLTELCGNLITTEKDLATLLFIVSTSHGTTLKLRPERDLLGALRVAMAKSAAAGASR